MVNISTSHKGQLTDSTVSVVRQSVRVTGQRGLTMLTCSRVIQEAQEFPGRVVISNDRMCADGYSMLELLQLAAETGTLLIVEVAGPDAGRMLRKITAALANDH